MFLTEGADLRDVNGAVIGSVVFADRASTVPLRDVLAHERVHVIQLDHAWAVWGAPLEGWALSSFGSSLPGWALGVDLAVFPTLVLEVFGRAVDRSSNPFEVEAEFLEIQWYR